MEDILQNQIKRLEYMEVRYKTYEGDGNKPDLQSNVEFIVEKTVTEKLQDEFDVKHVENFFILEKIKILEELGLLIPSIQSYQNENK